MFCSRYHKSHECDPSVEKLQQAIDDVNRNYTMVIPVSPSLYHGTGYSITVNLQWNEGDEFPTIKTRAHRYKNVCDDIRIFVKVTINDNPITIGSRAFRGPNFLATILVGVDSLPRIYDSDYHYDVNRIFSASILDEHVTLLDAMKTCSIPVFPETWRVVPDDRSLCVFTLCTNKSVVCYTNFDAYTIDDFSDLDVAASKTGVSETKYIVLPTRGFLNTIRGLVINPIGSPDFGYVPLYCIGLDSDPNMRLPPANFRFMPLSTIQEL